MADATSLDHVKSANGILSQLQNYIQQLIASENDPSVDITALSRACAERFKDLELVLPMVVNNSAGAEDAKGTSLEKSNIAGKARELVEQTQLCIQVLERGRDKTAGKLKVLVNAKRVLRAYST